MGEKRGMKALEMWCRRVTDGYRGVKVDNMTTSWRDGLAFCALIHHFRPDLIDFESLNKDDIFRNNELAFRTAEQCLGIPALLDAEDMVEYEVPDRLSILTYLSQFYQAFGGSQQGSPARAVVKRPSSSSEHVVVSESPPSKIPARPALPVRRDPCAKCGLPVFIAERLLVGGRTLYHRSCFRCARCQNPLSLANCYETEDGQYCCEACPDEVETDTAPSKSVASIPDLNDQYSAEFESALEDSTTPYQPPKDTFIETPRTCAARSLFMNSLMVADDDESSSDDSRIPSRAASSKDLSVLSRESSNKDLSIASRASSSKDVSVSSSYLGIANSFQQGSNESHEPISSIVNTQIHSSASSEVVETKPKDSADNIITISSSDATESPSRLGESSVSESRLDIVVQAVPQVSVVSDDVPVETSDSITEQVCSDSRPVTASIVMKDKSDGDDDDKNVIDITKDSSQDSSSCPKSIVKLRLKMFEQNDSSSVDTVDKAKTLKTNSNRRYVLNRKDTDEEMDNKVNTTKLKTSMEKINDLYGNNVSGINISGEMLGSLKTMGETEGSGDGGSLKTDKIEDDDVSLKEKCVVDSIVKTEGVSKTEEKQKEDKERSVYDETKTEGDANLNEKEKLPVIPAMRSSLSVEKLKQEDKDESVQENLDMKKDVETVAEKIPTEVKEASVESKGSRQSLSSKGNEIEYPEELNPFGDDDEEEEHQMPVSLAVPNTTPGTKSPAKVESTNPFGSSDEDESECVKEEPAAPPVRSATKPPRPPLPVNRLKTLPNQRRVVEAPKVNLNPFWSEGDEPSSEDDHGKVNSSAEKPPVPLPRTIKPATTPEPSPRPRHKLGLGLAGQFGSATSLSSVTSSSGGTARRRKKKPAPPPPNVRDMFPVPDPPVSVSSGSSRASSPTTSVSGHSPHVTPRRRKSRPAPPPPTSTPVPGTPPWEQEKSEKDEANRNRQSLSAISNMSSPTSTPGDESRPNSMPPQIIPNKSTFGQWKRKKGPAPPRPVPQRRQIKAIPMHEVRRELDDIEVKQQELERQGVTLEQTIRDKFEQTPNIDDSSITPDVEDLVLQLFELVNEKNELFRRQAELMYLRRQQRLEEEHADLEYQVRCLMERPESIKTDSDKAREEELIQRLVEVVERRNEIVECLEMDRLREAEEDHSIHTQLGIFAAKNKGNEEKNNEKLKKSGLKLKKDKKLKKQKEKEKLGSKKGSHPVIDVDKDIDESESLSEQVKEKKSKKKWFS
ncbi:MICAL-like protein 1 [Anabrus simplex]|uniref:MICAL-like protein 1 n=1 Tax=Anabrus simplex TaxID=316456 RepID=UPI0035A2A45D